VCARCSRDKIPCVYITNRSLGLSPQETELNDDQYASLQTCLSSNQKEHLLISSRANTRFQAVDRQLETLRREMRTLSARLHEVESTSASSPLKVSAVATAGTLHRILDAPKSPTYIGPTSAEFGLSRLQRSSSEVGDDAIIDGPGEELDLSTDAASPAPSERGVDVSIGDPLRSLGTEEALRLVQVYEDTVGVMYPCVDLDGVRAYICEYYRQDPTTQSPSDLSRQTASDEDWFSARDVQVLKTLLATALLVESHGRSERAAQLADSVEDRFASRLKIAEVDMKEILILTLLVNISNLWSARVLRQ
jgi:hypothetical protein